MLRGLRPSWDTWALGVAEAVSTRADCTRSKVGAVLLSRSHRVLSVGYNGAPSGIPGCASAGNCPRGRHYQYRPDELSIPGCACGNYWPCEHASEPASDYANCIATHAERNAIEHAPPEALPGSTLYSTREPCPACSTLIAACGIARVVVADREETHDQA